MEVPKAQEVTPEALKWYNLAQICIITYQKIMGLIKNDMEYIDGTSELFHMIVNRMVTFEREFDWKKTREEAEKLTHPTREQIFNNLQHG